MNLLFNLKKPESFYIMEVLTFDKLFTQYKGFFVYVLLLHVKILENAFEIHFGYIVTIKHF